MFSDHPIEEKLTLSSTNFSLDVEAHDTLYTRRIRKKFYYSRKLLESRRAKQAWGGLREAERVHWTFIVSKGWNWGKASPHGL